MPSSKDVRPFLTFATSPTRALDAALPAIDTPEVTSPWLPRKLEEEAAPPPVAKLLGPTPEELMAVMDEARAQGHAEGMAETEALRAQLKQLLAELAAAKAGIVAPTIEAIADAAACVVEAWVDQASPREKFEPVIRAWLGQPQQRAAIARVHPDNAEALRALIADVRAADAPVDDDAAADAAMAEDAAEDAAIPPPTALAPPPAPLLEIVADPAMPPGAIDLRGATLELGHDWAARLGELRHAIASALAGVDE